MKEEKKRRICRIDPTHPYDTAAVQKYRHFGNTTALGRPGPPEDLAPIYVQLAASDASFTTGNVYGAGGAQGQPSLRLSNAGAAARSFS